MNNNNNNEENAPFLPYELHDINVAKVDEDEFKIIFGTKTDIEGLYEGFAEVSVSRSILERFVERAQDALAK